MSFSQSVLSPGYKKLQRGEITGTRTRHVITLNPNKINPGEELYINIPKLKPGSALVPEMKLLYDFKNSNTKSWFHNNLSRILQKRLEVKFAGEKVYDNTGESLFGAYEDLWLPTHVRAEMMESGIATLNRRKVISGSDDATADAYAEVYKKQSMPIGKILRDHGLYAPHSMSNDLQYIITLPKSEEIMSAQSSQSVGTYSLENLEMEYETIENQDLVNSIESGYNTGRVLGFEHVTLFRTENWLKGTTLINTTVNLPRKSLRCVVMLFTENPRGESEEFVFPNITNVRITKEGVPNSVYSQGFPKRRFYEEACRVFAPLLPYGQSEMDSKDYYTGNKFALVVDLRSVCDQELFGVGAKIANSQSGIMFEITKTATTKDLKCQIFVVSDGLLKTQAGMYQGLSY